MTAERRLAKLEGALSPKAATLLWLAEAHQFGSLPAYVEWLIDQPISVAPLERVPAQARAAALEAMRGQPREAVQEAAHRAVRDAIFLVELVLKLNVVAEETIRIAGLRYAALFWEMRAIGAEVQLVTALEPRRKSSGPARRWTAWRSTVISLLGDLYGAEEARAHLERRYIDGASTLFRDIAAGWLLHREALERLAGIGDGVGITAGRVDGNRERRRRAHIDLRSLRAAALDRAPEQAASLVNAARAAALDALGDTAGAAMIAERRLRSRQPAPNTMTEPVMGSTTSGRGRARWNPAEHRETSSR
jgi:hypothetical protein